MDTITAFRIGPITEANVSFGDYTVLIGAQASGKSILLQLYKLLKDKEHIQSTLLRYNYLWKDSAQRFLDLYFGEGMSSAWKADSLVRFNGESIALSSLTEKPQEQEEALFYIPAQRILSITDGRPKNFMEFDSSSPYVLRYFSETLRLFVQNGLGNNATLFPIANRFKNEIRDSLDRNIFHQGSVILDTSTGQQKMRLEVDGMSLPFMTWSAGQKEIMPLLMGLYCISGPPTNIVKKDAYQQVIIEEPEMGLHPKAIQTVILQTLELLAAGKQVTVSTHSPVFTEFLWAVRLLQQSVRSNLEKVAALKELFGIKGKNLDGVFKRILTKEFHTYFFSREKDGKVRSKDISTLDVSSDDINTSEWGGLSQFATKAGEVVSKYL